MLIRILIRININWKIKFNRYYRLLYYRDNNVVFVFLLFSFFGAFGGCFCIRLRCIRGGGGTRLLCKLFAEGAELLHHCRGFLALLCYLLLFCLDFCLLLALISLEEADGVYTLP